MPWSASLLSLFNPNNPGTKSQISRVDTAMQSVQTPTHLAIWYWLRFMERACGERCPSGQRRGPAAPEKDKFPCPGQKSFHISTTPTTRRH